MIESIKNTLSSQLSCHLVEVSSSDNIHFSVLVVSNDFSHKSLLQRHRMVYEALSGPMKTIHALQLETMTEEEWNARKT